MNPSAPKPARKHRIPIDAINGPADQGGEGPDEFADLDNPISSTEHGLSNYEANYPDGVEPSSGPQAEDVSRDLRRVGTGRQ